MRQLLAERDGSRCFYCLEPVEDPTRLTFDHFAPACFLPVAESWNLVLSCCACNQAKASLLPRGLVLVLLAITFPDGEAMRSGETPADLREFPVREAA
ncbi:HNH endonuclease [Nonomuraea sp. bgisy101]|uniref:HNH endonuclease n=1 Tax=Nonomuraea sp. bgisy101 TaxID=3413784 RepID=UPI003D74F74A